MTFHHRPELLLKVRSDAIMATACGMPCTLRISSFIPGRTCTGRETTVGCHLPCGWGKGTSTKVTDLAVAFGCSSCHDIVDGRDKKALDYLMTHHPTMVLQRYLAALTETQALLLDAGVIVIPDGELI